MRAAVVGLLLVSVAINALAQQTAPQAPRTPVPALTDEDRAAAFPDLGGHEAHDRKIYSFILFDQFDWQSGDGPGTLNWDNIGWVGGDVNRLWFRTEGEAGQGRVHKAEAHLLYGRAFSRWWDFVAGVRQDVRPGPARTWAAAGIQGLAPYFFEVEVTAYAGTSGRTQVRLEAEYEVLITNRMVLQPHTEIDFFGKSDPQRGIGSGLSTAEAGLRLRYEIRREFAPYAGIVWKQQFGRTADFSRANAEETRATRLTFGIRFWF
jgi:copper resistance protein B